jgi:hypothetical protein
MIHNVRSAQKSYRTCRGASARYWHYRSRCPRRTWECSMSPVTVIVRTSLAMGTTGLRQVVSSDTRVSWFRRFDARP